MSTIYITGAGVSSESGIPTFRGQDGFWTVGSVNYTPQEMATREMYLNAPDEFLLWYFRRFAAYRNVMPNDVHHLLSDKRFITQNIDGLDSKADNPDYIAIHGRLDRVTMLHQQGELVPLLDAPWEQVVDACPDLEDDQAVKSALLDAFRISKTSLIPEMGHSLKPFVLLFDEYYTDLYRISEAKDWMSTARRFVFMGTSFSVNITNIALRAAIMTGAEIDVVDPSPIDLNIDRVTYHAMNAADFIAKA